MIFTRHLITCGLVIEAEHVVSPDKTLIFVYPDRAYEIGNEVYSLVICPHYLPDNPWRIEGLRKREVGDEEEIWFIGTMNACITEFERITQMIRDKGHEIIEPNNYDFTKEIREYQYQKNLLDRNPWNLGE